MLRLIWLGASLVVLASLPAYGGTIDDVRARGRLNCGVSEGLPGFSDRDAGGAWHGFDVDFCRAVAAAVLGDPDKVDYLPLSAVDRFEALTSGKIDLLSRNSTWTMSRDLGLGIDFAGVSYYDGQGFLAPLSFGFTSALQLQGARICVVTGTTTEANAGAYFAGQAHRRHIHALRYQARGSRRLRRAELRRLHRRPVGARRRAIAAQRARRACDHAGSDFEGTARAGDPRSRSGVDRIWCAGPSTASSMPRRPASALPASPPTTPTTKPSTTRRWHSDKPAAASLHLAADWLAVAIGRVGNYAEIFDRNLGEDSPLGIKRGINALWTNGGILYAPPMQ